MKKLTARKFTPAAPNELQIDADGWPRKFWDMLGMMQRFEALEIREVRITPSKTESHWHIRVFLKNRLTLLQRIALQAILGSDPVREFMNYQRVRLKSPHPILFLEY
jgi:hypothetical protein